MGKRRFKKIKVDAAFKADIERITRDYLAEQFEENRARASTTLADG